MIDRRILTPDPVKPSRLRWEIAVAMSIKIVLLLGLWFLIFRWQDRPAGKPDMAEHFALPGSHAIADFSSQP